MNNIALTEQLKYKVLSHGQIQILQCTEKSVFVAAPDLRLNKIQFNTCPGNRCI